MPWWVSLYVAAYLAFAALVHADDIKHRREKWWFVTAEILSDISLVVAATAFWLPSVQSLLRPGLFLMFTAGAAVAAGQAYTVSRRHFPDPELSRAGNLFVGVVGATLIVLLVAPLLYWGFRAAVLGESGT